MNDIHCHFSPTAYRSNCSSRMPLAQCPTRQNRSNIFECHLAFGGYAYLEPATEILLQLEKRKYPVGLDELTSEAAVESHFNEARWRFHNSSKTAHLIGFLNLLSFPSMWLIWGISFFTIAIANLELPVLKGIGVWTGLLSGALALASLVIRVTSNRASHVLQLSGLASCTALLLYLEGTLWDTTDLHLAYWAGASLYFMGAIGFEALLVLYARCHRPDGSEFNRKDGMVRFKRRFRRMFVAPFEEFDPVLRTLPLPYGGRDYTIVLYHRYTGASVTLAVKLHTLGLDMVNALAFWDCLQRYMDVTQPLPDLPVLEPYRHLDPVTVEHDTQTGRSPCRWRDQTVTGWKTGGGKCLKQQLEAYPWQQHDCVVRARLSETLTVWDYYKSLEARGVDISPKSSDYLVPHPARRRPIE